MLVQNLKEEAYNEGFKRATEEVSKSKGKINKLIEQSLFLCDRKVTEALKQRFHFGKKVSFMLALLYCKSYDKGVRQALHER